MRDGWGSWYGGVGVVWRWRRLEEHPARVLRKQRQSSKQVKSGYCSSREVQTDLANERRKERGKQRPRAAQSALISPSLLRITDINRVDQNTPANLSRRRATCYVPSAIRLSRYCTSLGGSSAACERLFACQNQQDMQMPPCVSLTASACMHAAPKLEEAPGRLWQARQSNHT